MTLVLEWLPTFLLVLVRLTTFFTAAPIFSLSGLPNTFKIGLAFFLTLVIMPTVGPADIPINMAILGFVVKEALIGLALGFVAALVLYTIQIAGAFIDFQMGFAIANVVDPQTGAQIPIIGNFKYTLAMLFLLAVNGHHLMIEGIVRSYRFVGLEQYFVSLGHEQVAYFITTLFVQMFLIAFQLSLPIVGALFLVDVTLGIIARTIPQLNVFVVGLPLKIFIGFVMLLLTLPIFFYLLQALIGEMVQAMSDLLTLIGA
ncbi:flagellar biosynthetic protein FliR [Caldalkalibacillus salinus]|uniref:flagellar biosynthetic protein FliR n=1 Tax=Caldalkalibacillus salinus TaxID=2803787 RepID=UPI00192242CC|nr:flagellar biosynthetic protein FliR [Caldalkalibacillus salinus]